MEKRGLLRDSCCLLHGMRDNDDGVILPQFFDEFFNPCGRNRVQGGTGLIHQDHIWTDGNRPSNAKPLLLASPMGRWRVLMASITMSGA